MKKGWKKQSLGGKRGKSEKIQDYRSERNESKDSHMYPPREVSGPLALVDLSLWAFQVWLPVSRRGSEKPFLDPSLLLWEVFVFTCTGPPDWAICLHSELWALDVNFYPAVSVCLGQKTWPPVRTQVTKQGCFKKLRAPLWRRCESWHRTSAALKTGFRTERSLRSAGWMERRHQMF